MCSVTWLLASLRRQAAGGAPNSRRNARLKAASDSYPTSYAITDNSVMADAYIAGWDSKFHYNLWRPETAIRMADADGNPQTAPDASFTPLLVTPPVQDYPSTHSALGAAAAVVLAETFGRDDVSFTFTSTSAMPANPQRSFKSFSEAARENADSRVKAGLHFRFATTAGLKLGEDIGRFAVRNSLTPLD